jgi:hypothetical protein
VEADYQRRVPRLASSSFALADRPLRYTITAAPTADVTAVFNIAPMVRLRFELVQDHLGGTGHYRVVFS